MLDYRTRLTDEKAAVLATCVLGVEEIIISGCQLTTRGVECIVNAIRQNLHKVSFQTRFYCIKANLIRMLRLAIWF